MTGRRRCRSPFADILDVFSDHSQRQHLVVGLQVGPLLSDSAEVVWYYVLSTDAAHVVYTYNGQLRVSVVP